MTFATLALVALAGVAGPVLAWKRSWRLPVVLGELVAGVAIGRTGARWVHPGDATFTFLADIGFALVMFEAGTHVPIRDPRLRAGAGRGALRAVVTGLVAALLGIAISHIFNTGHTALYAVLMSSSSAALVFPIVDSVQLTGASVLELVPQVAIADTVGIVALPLAIDPSHAARAGLGALAVSGCAAVAYLVLRLVDRSGLQKMLRNVSRERRFALELRVNLIVLFALAALAVRTRVSIMLAGFSYGLAVAAVGEPHRLARQVFGLTEGFAGPLFFIWLGASLNLRELAQHPSYVVLGVALGVGAVVSHLSGRLTLQPLAFGTLAAAQLGVPVAAATLGTQLRVLRPGEAPAVVLAALVTIAAATGAAALAGRAASRGAKSQNFRRQT